MGTTFGERLAVLQKKFTEAEHRFAGLKLDLLAPWASTAEPMTHKRWKAFLGAKVEGASPDTIWDPFPDGRFLGRFSGHLDGLPEFEEIAREPSSDGRALGLALGHRDRTGSCCVGAPLPGHDRP